MSMLSLKKVHFFCTIIFGLFATFAFGQYPNRPETGFIFDENRLMSRQEAELFNSLSEELYKKTGTPMVCVLIDDIKGLDYKAYANEIHKRWNLDNGILIFTALKQQKRTVVVAENLHENFSESKLEQLEQQTLVKNYRLQKYGQGIISLGFELAKKISKDKNIALDINKSLFEEEEYKITPRMFLFLMFVFFLLLMSKFSGRRSSGRLWFLPAGFLKKSSSEGLSNFAGSFGSRRKAFDLGSGNTTLTNNTDTGTNSFGGGFAGGRRGFGGGFGGNW